VRRAALLGALALAACASPGAPAPGDAWFPLRPDAYWLYEIRTDRGRLELGVKAIGEQVPLGGELPLFVVEETLLGETLGFAATAPVAYVVDSGFVARVDAVGYDGRGRLRALGRDAPTWILPLDPRPGRLWVQESHLFELSEGGGARLEWRGEIAAAGPVRVPAGTFPEALEVRITYRNASRPGDQPELVHVDTYVRGVGLVRSLTLDPDGDPGRTIEKTLLRYRIPD
jgi:hypothetical protein